MSLHKVVLLSLFCLLSGFFIGVNIDFQKYQDSGYKEQHSGKGKLTNKLLDFDIPPSNELGNYKNHLEDTINSFLQNKKAAEISVYFRDLNNGPWIGVNEEEKFIPASLLKVPLMMVYYKIAESNPSILSKKYKYNPSEFNIESSKYFTPKDRLQEGKEYAVDELIKRMIIFSDNEALFILSSHADVNIQKDLYLKLGFPFPDTIGPSEKFMTPRNIASFFRVLYNATYLNEEMSNKALQLLTETDFERGLVAGVPKEVIIAQKYGEREESGIIELHDCGIVYFPKHPYSLCVMTKGTNYENLTSIIKDISKLTYDQVDKSN